MFVYMCSKFLTSDVIMIFVLFVVCCYCHYSGMSYMTHMQKMEAAQAKEDERMGIPPEVRQAKAHAARVQMGMGPGPNATEEEKVRLYECLCSMLHYYLSHESDHPMTPPSPSLLALPSSPFPAPPGRISRNEQKHECQYDRSDVADHQNGHHIDTHRHMQ